MKEEQEEAEEAEKEEEEGAEEEDEEEGAEEEEKEVEGGEEEEEADWMGIEYEEELVEDMAVAVAVASAVEEEAVSQFQDPSFPLEIK